MRGPVERIGELRESGSPRSHRFGFRLLGVDIATVAFVNATSSASHAPWIKAVDEVCGPPVLLDLGAWKP